MKFGTLWAKIWGWPWQTLGSIQAASTVWEGAEILYFGHPNNAQFHLFSVGQFSRILHTTTSIGVAMWTFRTEFWKFYHKGSFLQKTQKMSRKCSNFRPSELRNDNRWPETHGQNKSLGDFYSYHFYCWNQFKVIPLECTLRNGTYVPQKFSFWWSDADHGITWYICNDQEVP